MLVLLTWYFSLTQGFVNHAGMVGLGMSLHFEFFINSWCHSWKMPPSPAEQNNRIKVATTRGGELDVHGSKQVAQWEPCKGTNHHWVGLLNAGEGYHASGW